MYEKMNAEVFLKVAETGSFRKAADQLDYTQAGISYIINTMEAETGLSLFIREHNGVRLSREGEAMVPHMKQLLIWEHQMKETVAELSGLERGVVRVQIFDSISIHWIPGILRKFHDDFPNIRVELVTEEDSLRAEEMVLTGEADCGFFLTHVRADLDVIPLIEENMKVVVAVDHPLAKLEKFPIRELANYPYIGMKYDEHTGIGHIFDENHIEPNVLFRMDNDYAAMAMVSKDLGYGIFPELLLQDVPYELRCMEFDIPQKRVISIGTASFDTCSKACRKFMEYTEEWVREHSITGERILLNS